MSGRLQEATEDAEYALDLDPENVSAYLARAAAYRDQDWMDLARKDMESALDYADEVERQEIRKELDDLESGQDRGS